MAPKARAFLASLKVALAGADRQKVAAMVQYPLSANAGKTHRVIRDSAEFVKDYDRLFTAAVLRAVKNQVPECLFANWQGVMIGSGEVWFEEQTNGSMKIKTINIP